MALIKCPECGKDVSDRAPACIHCGYPLTSNQQEQTNSPQTPDPSSNPRENVISVGFTLFSLNENSVNVECNNCSKVYKLSRAISFTEASEKGCVANNTICCPNCGNSVPKGTSIYPKQMTQSEPTQNQQTTDSHKEDSSGTGCLIYMLFLVAVIIGGIWISVDLFDGFRFGVAILWIFIVFVVGMLLYSLFTSDPKEVKQSWDKEKYNDYKFTCPMCGSKKVKKIGTVNRAASVAAVGLASSKIGKQYECDDCKHKW